ncbi:MAG: DNA-formamidopyrimidine glycosylase [Candidatus Moraniibacteriota bacterium]
MPELPEVETTIRYLRPKIIGRKIKDIWTDWPKGIGNVLFPELQKTLKGKSISAIDRRGKNILLEIDKKITLWIHLKMTGHLLLRPLKFSKESPFSERVNQYIHFRFILDKDQELAFSDLRKFGRVRYLGEPITHNLISNNFGNLGIEPFSKKFTEEYLTKLIIGKKNKNKQLKIFLMDQGIIAGIGNIYASEIPFEAKLNPRRKMSTLKEHEIAELFNAIKTVLQKAVDTGGTSISDFRDPEGKPGGYGNIRKVYQRKGQHCPNKCGGIVESFKQGQRTTFWCPKCQK